MDHDVAAAVEAVLAGWLAERTREAHAVDRDFGDEVAARLERFVCGGGKRLRARFAWWGWRAFGGAACGEQARTALLLGAALEVLQGMALIHDDVMDGSGLRRGSPAVHVDFADWHAARAMRGSGGRFGESAAVLAGDLALAWADDLVAELDVPPATRRELRLLWRRMRLEMVAGQYLDVRAQASRQVSAERALRVAYLKSAAYTVERPLGLGAALAGAPAAMREDLAAAARCAGVAFQLRDDVLGVFGDPDRTGKPSGDDVRDGKVTYLVTVAEELARTSGDSEALDVLRTCQGDAELTPEGLERYRETVTALGALEAVEERIEDLVEESLLALEKAAPDAAAHRELSRLMLAAAGSGRVLAPAMGGGAA
ncbi:polyprenyl synthetase family protein [Streptomyces sp. 549]|uniref:polyprenyl synthetase family protein n=1 Tax=Streptomyces sp. 549 TaxID=3049076 RepID=UPI0024C46547|nr:polyprenyl synthetase family protein [Streptomyces sp. 549]MDK1474591.1 polyprenyl synthetase family protein [Streptomyces sp. 549]